MRIRIIIDTEDADEPDAVDTPFTLNVHRDRDDGTESDETAWIAGEGCVIGDDIPQMLQELSRAWAAGVVIDASGDEPLPRTGDEWRECRDEED